MTCSEQIIIDSIAVDINILVDASQKELEERKSDELSIVLFYVPEHKDQDSQINKQRDEDYIQYIFNNLGFQVRG